MYSLKKSLDAQKEKRLQKKEKRFQNNKDKNIRKKPRITNIAFC